MSGNGTESSTAHKRTDEIGRQRHKRRHEKHHKSKEHRSSRSSRELDNREATVSSRRTQHDLQLEDTSSLDHHQRTDEHFCFSNHKHALNKVFSANPNLVHDVADFWKFVEKYESVRKQSEDSSVTAGEPVLNSLGVPERYDKRYCLNFKLSIPDGELFARVPDVEDLTKSRLLKFKDVILLYMNFNQRQKFNKLRKLRDAQANLPVAQYKEEIIKTVREEKVVIIAGDTGCGKSTQIPQYLHEAGFQKIGELNCTWHCLQLDESTNIMYLYLFIFIS